MVRSLVPWTGMWPRSLEVFPREWENVMERFFGAPTMREWEEAEKFIPRMNVAETENEFEVTVELPGMKPEEVKVELENGNLKVYGERKEEKEEKEKTFHRIERKYGSFYRVFALPAMVEEEKIAAKFHEGVLTVTLPKTEKVKPKQIEVKA